MALTFPNQSRSFDATRRAVRFWGYHTAMEASFFVTVDALKHIQPDGGFDEDSLLRTFDLNRERICAAAEKAFRRGPRGSYELTAQDF